MKTGYLWRIASITKTFTANVVLRLVDEKKLSLEDTGSLADNSVTIVIFANMMPAADGETIFATNLVAPLPAVIEDGAPRRPSSPGPSAGFALSRCRQPYRQPYIHRSSAAGRPREQLSTAIEAAFQERLVGL